MNFLYFSNLGAPGSELPIEERAKLARIKLEDGFPIGRIISETFLRSELVATVRSGSRLQYWADHVLNIDQWFIEIIERFNPVAFVTGHIDYCPWGHLAERLVRRKKRVVYFRCDTRVPIYLIDDIKDDETLNGRVRRADSDAFFDFEQSITRDSFNLKCLDGPSRRTLDCG